MLESVNFFFFFFLILNCLNQRSDVLVDEKDPASQDETTHT